MEALLFIVGGLCFAAGVWVGQLGSDRDEVRDEEIDWQSHWGAYGTLDERTSHRVRADPTPEAAGDANRDYHLRLP